MSAIDGGFSRSVRHRDSGRGATKAERQSRWPALPIIAYMVALPIPWIVQLGTVALPTYRFVLLLLTVPAIVRWAGGHAGRIRLPDILVLAFCIWSALGLAVVEGVENSIQSSGVLFVETCGAYFLGRVYVRTADDYLKVARLFFWVVAFLLPFALIEAFTGTKPLMNIARLVMPTLEPYDAGKRAGLWRVQGPFEHSILFGVFCSAAMATTFLVLGRDRTAFQRYLLAGTVFLTTALALSSGALFALAAQCLLIAWNWLFRSNPQRWKILWGLIALMYLTIDTLSNQSVAEFFISRFAFDGGTGYFRLVIWHYGVISVMMNPWFGVGLDEWPRPAWMPISIDMFWLIWAVRSGLPAALFMFGAFLAACLQVGFHKGYDERLTAYRTAYLLVMTGFFIAGWTVHFWNGTFTLFMFMLGSGLWLLDATPGQTKSAPDRTGRPSETRQRRRPVRPGA